VIESIKEETLLANKQEKEAQKEKNKEKEEEKNKEKEGKLQSYFARRYAEKVRPRSMFVRSALRVQI